MITREEFGEISSVGDIIYYVEEYGLNEFYDEYNIIRDHEFSDYVEDDISNFTGDWTVLRELLNDMYDIWGCEYYCYHGAFFYEGEDDLDVDDMKECLWNIMIENDLIAEEEDDDSEELSEESHPCGNSYADSLKERAMNEYMAAKTSDSVANLDGLFC